MTFNGWLQIGLMLALVVATARPLGVYMTSVLEGRATFLDRIAAPIERRFYSFARIDPSREQSWLDYTLALLVFNAAGFVLLYAFLRLQGVLPLNPQGFAGMNPHMAFNTAASFTSNTNWQAYGGETTLSYFSQMAGLTVQNFVSAATGIAIVVPLARAFARPQAQTVGNFWVDITRTTLYILLPLAVVVAVALIALGVPQNLSDYVEATTLEGARQTIAQGPAASQIAIKQLGTNGGGFFNVNSAHPYENPNIWTDIVELWAILAISLALAVAFGRMIGKEREGWALLAVMVLFVAVGCAAAYWAEAAGNPLMHAMGVDGGNMEGKEVRFGIAASALFATTTTGASCGAVNSMHDSFTPIGGLVPLFNMLTNEVIFGGVGAGLYGMLLFAILAVFIAGLMVGRTPEYIGKKIESKEVKMAMLALIATAASVLLFAGASSVTHFSKDSYLNPPGPTTENRNNQGPHGLSQILYAYASGTGNNGSAFAGLNANTPWYNATLGLAMLIGRFLIIVFLLAAAGSLAGKRKVPASGGTFPTHGPLFVTLIAGTVVIVGALTFFPVLSLGPILEHFLMHQLRVF
jgi:K+-transporting ATPase ATPase A chain